MPKASRKLLRKPLELSIIISPIPLITYFLPLLPTSEPIASFRVKHYYSLSEPITFTAAALCDCRFSHPKEQVYSA